MRTRRAFVLAGLWAFLVVVAVHFLQFPGSVPDFTRASDGGILLDASPAFTSDGIYDRLAGYGEEGRKNYSFRNVTIDVLLPLSVLPFLLLLSRRALARYSPGTVIRSCVLAHPSRMCMNVLAASLPYTTLVKRAASLLALGLPLAMFGLDFVRRKQLLGIRRRT